MQAGDSVRGRMLVPFGWFMYLFRVVAIVVRVFGVVLVDVGL